VSLDAGGWLVAQPGGLTLGFALHLVLLKMSNMSSRVPMHSSLFLRLFQKCGRAFGVVINLAELNPTD